MDGATLGLMGVGLAGLMLGAGLGAAVAFALGAARATAAAEPARRDAEARAGAAAATAGELRRQVDGERQRALALEAELRAVDATRAAEGARAAELERGLVEQRSLLAGARDELGTTFQALAAEALHRSQQGFLQLATEKLAAAGREGESALEARQLAIASLVNPVKQSLDKMDTEIRALELARGQAYVQLTEQVRALADGQKQLQSETGSLVNALRAPAVRGRWGEVQLRRVVEMVGMIEHCDFVEQATAFTADGRLRPDMVVRLPAGVSVVVDAKTPLVAYLEAEGAVSEEQRAALLRQHAAQVKAHLGKLGAKSYWEQFSPSPELVVMFLPGESFYSAALKELPGLIEEAYACRVLVATPTTLIGILQAIHYGWRQERLAANAEEISRCGRELHERLATLSEHVAGLGGALGRTVEAFNRVAGSFESRVMPGARRLEELGARGKKELPDVDPVSHRPRVVALAPVPDVRPKNDDASDDADDEPGPGATGPGETGPGRIGRAAIDVA